MDMKRLIVEALDAGNLPLGEFTIGEPDEYGRTVVRPVDGNAGMLEKAYLIVATSLRCSDICVVHSMSEDPSFFLRLPDV